MNQYRDENGARNELGRAIFKASKFAAKPAKHKTQGKKIKRAIFWNKKPPNRNPPKGFVGRGVTEKQIEKKEISNLFGL